MSTRIPLARRVIRYRHKAALKVLRPDLIALVGIERHRSLGQRLGIYKRVLIILSGALASGCGVEETDLSSSEMSERPLQRTSLIALLGVLASTGPVEVSGFCAWDSIDGHSALFVREEDADRRLSRNGFRLDFDTGPLTGGTDLLVPARDTAGREDQACPRGYYTVIGSVGEVGPDEIWSGVLIADSIRAHP